MEVISNDVVDVLEEVYDENIEDSQEIEL